MTLAPAPLVHRVKLALALPEQSPLDYWHHAAPQLREATRLTNEVDEVAVRAPNGGGKTEWGTAVVLACCMGRRELDGIPIPFWRGRVDALELARDYKQQKLSTQQTYLRLIGNHPHRCRWSGDDVLSSMRVRHVDSTDDESTWSLITFQSQENKRAGLGARADIVRGDEPPDQDIWHEARKAAHAGRRGLRLLTYTPIRRPEWWWIKEEYGDGPRGQVRRVGEHWAEVRYSLEDNTVLSPARKATLIDEFMRMGLIADARIHGDFVDVSGECPFDETVLAAMMAECVDPEIVEWRITREVPTEDETGAWLAKVVTTVPVEVFGLAKPGRTYYCNIDSSAGIKSPKHDPGALEIAEVGSGDLMVSFEGALGSYGLGVLAAGLCRQYNDATADPETTGGWGEGVLRGLADSGYGNVSRQRRELSPGKWHTELGFKTTVQTRPAMISAVQAWVDARGQGIRYARCPSRKVIQTLMDTVLDETGKPVAAPGRHDEHLILWGQKLRKCVNHVGRFVPPDIVTPPRNPEADIIARIMAGTDDDNDTPFGQVATVPRARPRGF